jgi:ElaB/YqjD/DUF883 family membrane-anchored ribosome-binding protein
MTEIASNNKDKLVTDLRSVVADAEAVLQETASVAGEKMGELRTRLRERLVNARHKLAEAEEMAVEKARAAARATDDYVHEHPWKAVGAAAGVGLILGLLIGRR